MDNHSPTDPTGGINVKRLQTYSAPGITVTFDPNICSHSAACLSSLPAVFDVRRRHWVQPEAATVEDVVAAIERCPSGALKYVLDGRTEPVEEPAAAEAGTTIQVSMSGPLLVQGSFALLDEGGATIRTSGRAALCRCGSTGNQPFCDGSHRAIGFQPKRNPGV